MTLFFFLVGPLDLSPNFIGQLILLKIVSRYSLFQNVGTMFHNHENLFQNDEINPAIPALFQNHETLSHYEGTLSRNY